MKGPIALLSLVSLFTISVASAPTLAEATMKNSLNHEKHEQSKRIINSDRYHTPLTKQINGWNVSSFFNTDSPIAKMTADFTVPKNPKVMDDGQLNYFFPAITTASWDYILQPVIRNYKKNASGSSREWSMTAWYLNPTATSTTFDHYRDSYTSIHSGDKITTKVERNGLTSSHGTVEWTFLMKDLNSGVVFTSKHRLPDVNYSTAWPAAMETYGGKRCGDLAGSPFTVTNFHVYDASGREMISKNLHPYNNISSCHAKINILPKNGATITSDGNY